MSWGEWKVHIRRAWPRSDFLVHIQGCEGAEDSQRILRGDLLMIRYMLLEVLKDFLSLHRDACKGLGEKDRFEK